MFYNFGEPHTEAMILEKLFSFSRKA